MEHSQDRRRYLSDLVFLYTEQLKKPIAETFGELIQEEQKECIQELDLIKQVDMEATYMAKSRSIKDLLFP